MSRNCWCGTRPEANCVECGSGICQNHKRDFDYKKPYSFQTIVGADLEDTARQIGYWSKPRNSYYCNACRTRDCKPAIAKVRRLRTGWGDTPFRQALNAARRGYVYEDIGISTRELLESWAKLGFRPQTMQVPRMIRPQQHRSPGFITGRSRVVPAKIASEHRQGWLFPRTYPGTADDMHGCPQLNWEPMTVLTDGTLVHDGHWTKLEEMDGGNGYAYRLVVEMARFVATAKGVEWDGPEENW